MNKTFWEVGYLVDTALCTTYILFSNDQLWANLDITGALIRVVQFTTLLVVVIFFLSSTDLPYLRRETSASYCHQTQQRLLRQHSNRNQQESGHILSRRQRSASALSFLKGYCSHDTNVSQPD